MTSGSFTCLGAFVNPTKPYNDVSFGAFTAKSATSATGWARHQWHAEHAWDMVCFFYRFRSDIRPLFPSRRLCRLCQNANKTHLKMSLFGLFSAKPAISVTCWARQTLRENLHAFSRNKTNKQHHPTTTTAMAAAPATAAQRETATTARPTSTTMCNRTCFLVEGFRGNDNAGNARLYADSARIPILAGTNLPVGSLIMASNPAWWQRAARVPSLTWNLGKENPTYVILMKQKTNETVGGGLIV